MDADSISVIRDIKLAHIVPKWYGDYNYDTEQLYGLKGKPKCHDYLLAEDLGN
jgi:hypothetical protein